MSQRILLFESDGDFALEISAKFEAIGATVDVVADGARGLELAAVHRPDLILLSIELPGMNGFLVCKKIKKQAGLESIPLLILSSEATEDVFDQHKKLRTRADDYIHKPIAFADLLERVKRFMNFDDIDASVVEDDDEPIEIADLDDEDVVLIDGDSAAPPRASQPAEPASATAEVRAFAEAAFQTLVPDVVARAEAPATNGDGAETDQAFDVDDYVREVSSGTPSRRESWAPSASLQPGDRVGRLEAELGRAERRARDAEQLLQAQSQRASAAERSLAEASKRGGASSREFLDLREQLNRKDRELLALRDQVGVRDKQLLEANDKSLMFERELADRADKNLELHRELEKTRDLVDTLQTDKEGAKKRFEDSKARFERIELKNRDLAKELDAVKAAQARESSAFAQREAEARTALEQHHAAAAAALQHEHEAALAQLRSEHGTAIEVLRETLTRQAAEAEREHELSLTAERERGEREREAALAELRNGLVLRAEQELTALRQKHEAGLLQLRGELAAKGEQAVIAERARHEAALAQLRSELEAESEGSLAVARTRHEQALAEQRAELGTAAERSLAQAKDKHETALGQLQAQFDAAAEQRLAEAKAEQDRGLLQLRGELTSAFDQRLAEDRAKHEAVISQALTAHEHELTGTRQMLERKHATESNELRERHAQELARLNAALAELQGEHGRLQEQLAAAEATRADTVTRLSKIITERDQKSELVDHLQSQVDQAMRQRASEEQVLERARKALAIGLSLLEDHKDGQPR